MTDVHTKEQRSYNMSCVKGRNTKLELDFRRKLFKRGLRGYRVNVKIPGKPDVTFSKYKLAIFIDGCFWHKCSSCFALPNSNKKFWKKKIDGNIIRDKRVNLALIQLGFTVLRFWEHEIKKDINKCIRKIVVILKHKKTNIKKC